MTTMNAVLSLFPRGFVFNPTDEKLLDHYLYHKIAGDFDPPYSPPVIDLYGHEPSLLWQQLGGIDGQDLHFYTKLKKKKSRVVRKVGSNGGTWSGENRAVQIFSSTDDRLIGTVKRFHYENSKVSDDCYSWIMHEYTLDRDFVPKGMVHDSLVLCKIHKRSLNKKRKREVVPIQMQYCDQVGVNQSTNQVQIVESGRNDDDLEYLNNHIDFTLPSSNDVQLQICSTTQMEFLDQNPNDVEPNNTCSTTQMEFFDQNPDDDVGLANANTCLMTQMEFLDQNSNDVEYDNTCPTQVEFFDQNFDDNVELANTNTCSTTQMKFLDQNFNDVEPNNTSSTTQMGFFDQDPNSDVESTNTNTCYQTTQMEVYDQHLNYVDYPSSMTHMELLTQNFNDVEFDNTWSTQMEFFDQNENLINNVELADTNTWYPTTEMEVYNPNLNYVEHPMEFRVHDNVEPTLEENIDLDTEWWSDH